MQPKYKVGENERKAKFTDVMTHFGKKMKFEEGKKKFKCTKKAL